MCVCGSYIEVAEVAGAEGGTIDTDPCFHADSTSPPDQDQPSSVYIVNEKSPSAVNIFSVQLLS